MNFIAKVETQHTGGNCMADVLELKSGKVIVISDEALFVYPNRKTWEEGPVEEGVELEVEDPQWYGRCVDLDGPSEVGLTFVQKITTYEPDGPVSVDLLHLADGSVVGIDGEIACLYPSIEAFDSDDGVDRVEAAVDL